MRESVRIFRHHRQLVWKVILKFCCLWRIYQITFNFLETFLYKSSISRVSKLTVDLVCPWGMKWIHFDDLKAFKSPDDDWNIDFKWRRRKRQHVTEHMDLEGSGKCGTKTTRRVIGIWEWENRTNRVNKHSITYRNAQFSFNFVFLPWECVYFICKMSIELCLW